ncbi:probable trehalose-phosphate phosphatase C isoform X2 [Contarinia nasturtii]|uniref:probable trehalose-phosphate phosphatase C isoform X2 n=1 Tax=Contarinia nasturtii TaxID=265458 RepID=UPI0012D46016|nr:probable trehalose-phosphate phosphatase C isoform X2 [Contarinia nasturtii]
MSPCVKCELLTVVLISLVNLAIQSPLIDDRTASNEYLVSRDDVDAVLSEIIKPDDSVALLSDFDGTLSIINPIPALTTIIPEAKDALDQLVTRSNILIGIISGRPMYNVRTKVGIDNATYAGNHGMEIVFANHTEFHYPITPEIYENCTKLRNILQTEYQEVYGGILENKNISLVFHYRFIAEHLQSKVISEITALVKEYGYIPVPAHAAIEIKPPVDWSKGHAAQLIMNEMYGSGWEKNIRTIYMGDDTSDEDVMKMLKDKATTFRITDDPDIETFATYKMKSAYTATFILEWLTR